MEHTLLSNKITKQLSKQEKKDNGIFFTPKTIIEEMVNDDMKYFNSENIDILEPSCGGCDIVDYINNTHTGHCITGVEMNETIYQNIKDQYENTEIINDDFLKHDFKDKKFDYIPGNPPYFLLKNKLEYIELFPDYILKGKVNIFSLFIYKSLTLLKECGIVSFVLPINFLTVKTYSGLRKHICDNFKITRLSVIDNTELFKETKQTTCIISIMKINNADNTDYIINKTDYVLTDNKDLICEYQKYKTLSECEIPVSVGTVVNNYICNDFLGNGKTKTDNSIILLNDFNIKDNNIVINDEHPRQYITPSKEMTYDTENKSVKKTIDISKKIVKSPFILIERGRGQKKKLFNAALVNDDKEYLIENHVYILKVPQPIICDVFDRIISDDFVKLYSNFLKTGSITKNDILSFPLFLK